MEQIQLSNKEIISDYNRIYSGPGIRTNTAYYRWLICLLKPKQRSSLLDVSCGEGVFLKEFAKYVKDARVYGLDISDKALVKSHSNIDFAGLVNADGQFIPFKGEVFDYVTCLGSLEHYLDPEKGMRELCRVGKKRANFCIILPNSVSIDFLMHVARYGEKPIDDFQIIERTATKKEWGKLLEKNGLKVVRVYGSNLWPELFQEGSFRIKSFGKYFKRKLIKTFCPVNLAREFVFICEKR